MKEQTTRAIFIIYLSTCVNKGVEKRSRSCGWQIKDIRGIYFVFMYITGHDGYAQMTKGHRRASM